MYSFRDRKGNIGYLCPGKHKTKKNSSNFVTNEPIFDNVFFCGRWILIHLIQNCPIGIWTRNLLRRRNFSKLVLIWWSGNCSGVNSMAHSCHKEFFSLRIVGVRDIEQNRFKLLVRLINQSVYYYYYYSTFVSSPKQLRNKVIAVWCVSLCIYPSITYLVFYLHELSASSAFIWNYIS